MACTSMTARTAVAEEWQSGSGSLARQVAQGQGDSYFLFLPTFLLIRLSFGFSTSTKTGRSGRVRSMVSSRA